VENRDKFPKQLQRLRGNKWNCFTHRSLNAQAVRIHRVREQLEADTTARRIVATSGKGSGSYRTAASPQSAITFQRVTPLVLHSLSFCRSRLSLRF
jgi:hypothetical protein